MGISWLRRLQALPHRLRKGASQWCHLPKEGKLTTTVPPITMTCSTQCSYLFLLAPRAPAVPRPGPRSGIPANKGDRGSAGSGSPSRGSRGALNSSPRGALSGPCQPHARTTEDTSALRVPGDAPHRAGPEAAWGDP